MAIEECPRRSETTFTHRRPRGTVEGWLREAGFAIEASSVIRPDDDVPGAVVHARSTQT